MADELDRILDRIEADLAAVEDALAALEAGADLPFESLRQPVEPGDLADLLAGTGHADRTAPEGDDTVPVPGAGAEAPVDDEVPGAEATEGPGGGGT
jgi:hypothetical protein